MGDRANIAIHDSYEPDATVYLYTHWTGYRLPETLAKALERAIAEDRADDDPYLARIIFSEMIRDDIDGTTGYGISAVMGDGGDQVIHVYPASQTLKDYDGNSMPFGEFVKNNKKAATEA